MREIVKGDPSRYHVEAVMRACDILDTFRAEGELLRLTEISARTGISKATAFRLLNTLEHRGLVERVGSYQFRLAIRRLRRHRYRIGFGAQSTEFSFSRTVTESVENAARPEGIELVVLNNRYGRQAALRNVDQFIRHKMDLVIEFQTEQEIAQEVSDRLSAARIPLIAVEIPHPGATYFGANNYSAGLLGGRYLGRYIRSAWAGKLDELVMLELPRAGALPQSRLQGVAAGFKQVIEDFPESRVVRLNGNGQFGKSLEVMRRHLQHTQARYIAVAGINDPSSIGALRAIEEAGRTQRSAVIGQNASMEARAELRMQGTRLIGSVGYFPEQYGERLLPLACDLLEGRPVPPAVFVRHQMITPQNVDHFYPNDGLMTRSSLDMVLLSAEEKVPRGVSINEKPADA